MKENRCWILTLPLVFEPVLPEEELPLATFSINSERTVAKQGKKHTKVTALPATIVIRFAVF